MKTFTAAQAERNYR